MKIQDQYSKEEVIGILDEVQDKIITNLQLHERYKDSKSRSSFNSAKDEYEECYIAAYDEANQIVVRIKSDLRGNF